MIPNQTCKRCGTCCRKGGPGLHRDDAALVERGAIPVRYLFTLRRGEPAYDNIKQRYAPLPTDLIKIKGRAQSHTCVFFDELSGCSIYVDRPLECRLLTCWDTSAIEAVYTHNRLTRESLLKKMKGVWEVVSDHHARCAYADIGRLAQDLLKRPTKQVRFKLLDTIHYDRHLRQVMVEKKHILPEQLDFLLGRPLIHTITMFGLKLNPRGDDFGICHSPYKL